MTAAMTDVDYGQSRLVVRHAHRSTPDALAAALARADQWLGPEVPGSMSGRRRLHADLRLRISDNPSLVTFRKAAYVDIGEPADLGNGWEAEIGWQAATLAPLFPVFSGWLIARDDESRSPGGMRRPAAASGG